MTRNAIGIVRVSAIDGRDGDSFASPELQEERIRGIDGLNVLAVHPELDVSGGKPLAKRGTTAKPGLLQAVEAIERGEAEVLVAAYFDRLFRSLKVQAEVVERVERAGGKVLALDVGHVSSDSAAQWLSGTMLGAVSEYYRRSIGERIYASDARAIKNGKPPFPRIPLGYRRSEKGPLEPDPATLSLAVEIFTMRADGASWQTLLNHLAAHGITYSQAGLRALLANRIYLGELRFGELHNHKAHKAIIGPELFERVQSTWSPRGRVPRSQLLLARMRLVRCDRCGSVMGPATWVHQPTGQKMKRYRCPTPGPGHASIDAKIVDDLAADAAWLTVADMEGRAAANRTYAEAKSKAEASQSDLDAAVRTFVAAGIESEPAVIEKLSALRDRRDTDAAHAASCRPTDGIPVYLSELERERATHDELRDLIAATLHKVAIIPGKRGDRWSDPRLRVTVHPRWGDPIIPQPLGDPV